MAIRAADKYSKKTFTTRALGGLICAELPVFFIDLIRVTLNGWHFTEVTCCSEQVDIIVSHQKDSFYIDATILDKPKIVDDLLDALNEFFLCLSYLTANKNNCFKLIHCASYVEDDKNIIVIGQKKSGKSELVLSKAISGNLIYADDLLLWNPKKGVFISLGLPLRIRKSSPLLSDHTLIKDKFLIGKNILYSHQKYFNNAKFGVSFSLDRLKTVDKNFKTKNVPIHKILTYLEQHLISDNFTSYKKDL